MTSLELAPEEQSLVEFTRELVRTPSVLGDEGEMAERVAAKMRELGFDSVEIDDAGNAVGVVAGKAAGPTILYDAHMDTIDVIPREAWKHGPFGGDIEDGRIWGRGSSDMKGALAAMIFAAGGLDRTELGGRVVVSGSVGEELIEGAALRVVMDNYQPDYVVIGEASGLDLVRAGRGRAELEIETHGKPSHASTPQQGVNAVHKMRRVIEEIEAIEMPAHPFVGRAVMCLTDIISIPHPAHSVVPSGCRATYERRLLPGDTREQLLTDLQAAFERAGAADTEISLAATGYTTYTGIRWDQPKWFPPWQLAEEHELVQVALRGLRQAGLDPGLASYQFCTNGAYSAGTAEVPTVGFGPSREELVHIVDEYLEIDQLIAACRGYAAISAAVLEAG
ncbi:MAG: YgeY family selenium metabolism-linked hydrolase [Acidobacteriota bacterium]